MALGAIIGYSLGKKKGKKKAQKLQQELDETRGRLRRERLKNSELTGYLNGLQQGGLNRQNGQFVLGQQPGAFGLAQPGGALAQPGFGIQPAGFGIPTAGCGVGSVPGGGFSQSQTLNTPFGSLSQTQSIGGGFGGPCRTPGGFGGGFGRPTQAFQAQFARTPYGVYGQIQGYQVA